VYWRSEAGPGEVLGLALPLVLSTSSLTLQVFIDRLFLAWYSADAIAAAIPAVCMLWLLVAPLWAIVGFAQTFVAQYHGAGQNDRVGPVIVQAVLIAAACGVAMLLLAPLAGLIFDWVGHEPAVRELEVVYFQLLLATAAPMLVMTAASGFFGGLGRTWVVFWINVIAAVVNVVLDYAMIFGHWGFERQGIVGAGWATVIAYVAGTAAAMLWMWLADEDGGFGIRRARNNLSEGSTPSERAGSSVWLPDLALIRRLLRFGGPAGMMALTETIAFSWFVFLVGRMGTSDLAATNIAFNINMLVFMPMIGFSTATQVMVGWRLGEERPDLAARSTWSAYWLAFAYTLTLAAGYLLTPDLFISLFAWNSTPEEAAKWYSLVIGLLRFVAVYSLFDMTMLIFSGALRGAGDTRFIMLATLGLALCVLVAPSTLVYHFWTDSLYVAWCFVTAYVVGLGATFFARFYGGVWRSMRVIERPFDECPIRPATD
jgi:MATE family multidrug resistance protein